MSERKNASRVGRQAVEFLENRTLLTVTSILNGTELRVFSDAGETLTVSRDTSTGNASVTANNAPVSGLPVINASALTDLQIITGSNDDTIDLSQLTLTDFPNLTVITVDSGDGNDTLSGLGGNDQLFGGDGNDSLNGASGDELLDGGDGNDTIDGAGGGDSILGGDGADVITGGAGADTIDAGQGQDTVDGGEDGDFVQGGAGHDSILGGDGDDTLLGGSEHDTILGGAGDDSLNGQGGRDSLNGEVGNDTLTGGNSNDVLDGGDGNDFINGNGGNDNIIGGDGDDRGLGGSGRDSLNGQSGNDTLDGQGGDDQLEGGDGIDVVNGGSGNDLVSGAPSVSFFAISDATANEGDAGTTTATFTVTVIGANSSGVTVDVNTADGTAVAGRDYTTVSSTLVFAPGVTTRTVDVPVLGDVRGEVDELFLVQLSNPTGGALLQDDTGIGTIIEDVDTQSMVTFIDFDSATGGTERVYTQAERDEIQTRFEADFTPFGVTFTQTALATGPFTTVSFNDGGPGGLAVDGIDFRNLSLGDTVILNVNGVVAPMATSQQFINASANIGAHELGHSMGLRHRDSFGPIGQGVPSAVLAAALTPVYPGPQNATEFATHVMSTPVFGGAPVLTAAINTDQFFSIKSAIKLSAFTQNGQVLAEQAGTHGTTATAQPILLDDLLVPNTTLSGPFVGSELVPVRKLGSSRFSQGLSLRTDAEECQIQACTGGRRALVTDFEGHTAPRT